MLTKVKRSVNFGEVTITVVLENPNDDDQRRLFAQFRRRAPAREGGYRQALENLSFNVCGRPVRPHARWVGNKRYRVRLERCFNQG